MKQLLRAASIGFGATLGAGAGFVVAGALVAIATRAAARGAVEDLIDRMFTAASSAPDQTRPDAYPGPCGESFGGGQGPCVLTKGHAPGTDQQRNPGGHADHLPVA